ncbi:hypothetical protein HDU99_008796, partial [Rhizoclosmatium hyalinum]
SSIHTNIGKGLDALKPHLIHAALVFKNLNVPNWEIIVANVKEAVRLINSLNLGKDKARKFFPDFDGLTDFVVRVAVKGSEHSFDGRLLYLYNFSETGFLNVLPAKEVSGDYYKLKNIEILDKTDYLLKEQETGKEEK